MFHSSPPDCFPEVWTRRQCAQLCIFCSRHCSHILSVSNRPRKETSVVLSCGGGKAQNQTSCPARLESAQGLPWSAPDRSKQGADPTPCLSLLRWEVWASCAEALLCLSLKVPASTWPVVWRFCTLFVSACRSHLQWLTGGGDASVLGTGVGGLVKLGRSGGCGKG